MTIYYKLDNEIGSIEVPASRMTGEMKRLARCGAIVKGVVADYDSDAVQNIVCDGVLADIDRANEQPERWDGMS
jgi:hypothetical protein